MKKSNIISSAIYMSLYIALCYVNPFSFGMVQVRVAEALCIMPIFDKFSVISLFLACFISNLLMGNIFDAIFGSIASLIALYLTYKIKSKNFFIKTSPIIIVNSLVIPFILKYAYGMTQMPMVLSMLSIALGEIISVYILGFALYKIILKLKQNI